MRGEELLKRLLSNDKLTLKIVLDVTFASAAAKDFIITSKIAGGHEINRIAIDVMQT